MSAQTPRKYSQSECKQDTTTSIFCSKLFKEQAIFRQYLLHSGKHKEPPVLVLAPLAINTFLRCLKTFQRCFAFSMSGALVVERCPGSKRALHLAAHLCARERVIITTRTSLQHALPQRIIMRAAISLSLSHFRNLISRKYTPPLEEKLGHVFARSGGKDRQWRKLGRKLDDCHAKLSD